MPDIVNERVVSFINSFDRGNSPVCMHIEREAKKDLVPVIRKETEAYLKTVLALQQPENLLEIGTGVGYSAILMSEHIGKNARITTVENYAPRIAKARENIELAKKSDVITLLCGDAQKVIGTLQGPYDFIFLDAAKAQYFSLLPGLLRLLAVRGVLIADNVLQEGNIVQSRYGVSRRNRTIYERMRAFLYEVTHTPQLTTTIVPIGDGITMSVKISENGES